MAMKRIENREDLFSRKATATALACMLGLSLAPGAALAAAGDKDNPADSGSHRAVLSVQAEGSGSSESAESGSASGEVGGSNSGDTNSQGEAASGSSESGSSGAAGSDSSSAASDNSEQSGSSGSSETGEGSSSSSSESGSSSSTSSESSSGSSTSSDASDSSSSSAESGASGTGSGSSEGEDPYADDDQVVLDLGASSTTVKVTELKLGQAPKVIAMFAGSSVERDLTEDPAFEMTYFGPEGGKTTTFDAEGSYSLRVSAASKDAKTKAGELVKGRSALILFKLEKEKPATADAEGSSTSGGAGVSADASSGAASNHGAAGADASEKASGSAAASASGADSSFKSDPVSFVSASAASASSSASSKSSSAASASTADSAASSTARRGVIYSYNRGSGGGVTYLAPVRITSSGTSTTVASVQGVSGPAAVWSSGSGAVQTAAVYNLGDKATDVSALVAQANGAELLFWGGGIEIAPLYIWSVDTSAMTRDDAFGLDLTVEGVPANAAVLRGVNGVDATALSIKQVGKLPAGLELFWRTSSVFFDGEAVDVYRFDPQSGEFEVVAQGTNTANGYVSFTADQGGDYLIVEAGAGPGAENADQPSVARVTELLVPGSAFADEPVESEALADEQASEGAFDGWAIPAALAAALASAGGVWLAMRRKMMGAGAKTKTRK